MSLVSSHQLSSVFLMGPMAVWLDGGRDDVYFCDEPPSTADAENVLIHDHGQFLLVLDLMAFYHHW